MISADHDCHKDGADDDASGKEFLRGEADDVFPAHFRLYTTVNELPDRNTPYNETITGETKKSQDDAGVDYHLKRRGNLRE